MLSSAKKKDSNWANLPEHLLDVVLDRLVHVPDYVRFSAVCKHWLSTAQFHHKKLRLKPSSQKQQLPMLLVHSHSSMTYSFHSVVGKADNSKAAEFDVPDYYKDMLCCGSSHGWLIFIRDNKFALTLVNPFTGATIQLPSVIAKDSEWGSNRLRLLKLLAMIKYNKIKKVKAFLSEDPSLCPDTYQVLVLCNVFQGRYNTDFIWLFRSASDSWVHVESPHLPDDIALDVIMSDAIYYRGKFYITGRRWFIIVEAANDSSNSSAPPRAIFQYLVLEQHPDSEWTSEKQYLVESCNGCLLYIERAYCKDVDERSIDCLIDYRFRVYQVNLTHDKDPMCTILLSLGGETLFIGLNSSLSVSTSKFSDFQPDCIYYTDTITGSDIGVYDIVRSQFAKRLSLGITGLVAIMSPQIWIVPEVNLSTTYLASLVADYVYF